LKVEENSYFRPIKKSRFSEAKIISVLKRQERGKKAKDFCRESRSAKRPLTVEGQVRGLSVSELERFKELEGENAPLKKRYAELSLVHERGIAFLVLYADCTEANILSDGFTCKTVYVRRNSAGFTGTRRVASELLIFSRDPVR